VDKLENKLENVFLGSGWAFPVSFSVGNLQLNISSNETNIQESINVILNTPSAKSLTLRMRSPVRDWYKIKNKIGWKPKITTSKSVLIAIGIE